MHTRLLPYLLTSTLAGGLLGQLQLVPIGPWDPYVESNLLPDAQDAPNAVPQRIVAARLTGLIVPDAVLLAGTSPCLMWAPSIHACKQSLPGLTAGTNLQANAIAVLRGGGVDPVTEDALVSVGTSGLTRTRRENGGLVTVNIGTTQWNGATAIATHPAFPNLVFGVASNGTTLLVANYTGSTWTTSSFQAQFRGNVTQPILAIEALDSNRDGVCEVAALTGAGLATYRSDSTGTATLDWTWSVNNYANPTGALARIAYGAPNAQGRRLECLAWLQPLSPPQDGPNLKVVACAAEASWYLADGDYLGLSSGDWSGDGQDDLALTKTNSSKVEVLINGYSTFPSMFAPMFGFDVNVDSSDSLRSSRAAVAFADFDGDTDVDFLRTVDGPTGRAGYFSLVFSKIQHDPSWSPGTLEVNILQSSHAGTQIRMKRPTFPSQPLQSNTVQVMVWGAVMGDRPENDTMQPTALIDTTMPLALDLPLTLPVTHNFFAILIRPVTLGPTGQIVAAGRGFGGTIVLDEYYNTRIGDGGGTVVPSVPPKYPLPIF